MCTHAKILISEKMKLILVVLFTQTLHFYWFYGPSIYHWDCPQYL